MRHTAVAIALVPLLCCSLPAAAAGFLKQGLWENTIKSDQMKAMPQLTPQQIEMMRQRGINMPQMRNGGMVTQMCVSKEMAERDSPPANMGGPGRSDCKSENFQRSGSNYSLDLVCNGPNMTGTGKVKGTMSGDSYASTYDFKGTAHGQPVSTHTDISGKYLGADCGSVKPIAMPK